MIASDRRSGSDQRSLSLTLSLTFPDLNLTIFPSIPCLVSGRRSEPVIIILFIISVTLIFDHIYSKRTGCDCYYQEGFAVPDEVLDGQDVLNDDEY